MVKSNIFFCQKQKQFSVLQEKKEGMLKNEEVAPFRVKNEEYDFVDPCPDEMKQVWKKLEN